MFVRGPGDVAGLLEIGISNEGDKAAEWANVNALFPDWIETLYWCDPEKRHPDGPDARRTLDTDEVLTDAEGRSSAAKFLMHTYRVVTRRTHRVRYIYFGPYGVGRSVPIRVKIESDDQPEDKPEVVAEFMARAMLEGESADSSGPDSARSD